MSYANDRMIDFNWISSFSKHVINEPFSHVLSIEMNRIMNQMIWPIPGLEKNFIFIDSVLVFSDDPMIYQEFQMIRRLIAENKKR